MKSLIAAALLLALISPASAETCIGRVKIGPVLTNEELFPKGYREFHVGKCSFEDPALQKKVLHMCRKDAWCRVVGPNPGNDVIDSIDSVIRIDPYQEGMHDWREGQCFRARPYEFDTPEQKEWIRGYHAEADRLAAKYRHRRYVEVQRGCPGKYVR
jgi:hypothetical protein